MPLRVLYLTPWYPSQRDAMSGLFVLKHVEAVRAGGAEVRVIFSQTWRDTLRQWRKLRLEGWMPDIVQLNVIQKQAALALMLRRRYHIPYIIVEHWSGYMPENGMFKRMSRLKQAFIRRAAREAEAVLTVSLPLQRAMQASGLQARRWDTIDNVVDEFFYEPSVVSTQPSAVSAQSSAVKTLLHVSCFDEQAKNVTGLLRAAKILSEQRRDWRLVLVGTGVDYDGVRAYADSLDIPAGLIEWTGELTPQQVARRMHRADALVLSSRYETYGVVLAEAAAAGLPILSTPVGIAPEVAQLIVPQEIAQHKPGRFAEFIESILFDNAAARPTTDTSRFRAAEIARKLIEAYDSCLHRNI